MSPSQSGMILRSLERMEAAQATQAKQIKMLEIDNDLLAQRVKGLGEENVSLKGMIEHQSLMTEQLLRRGGRGSK